MKTRIIASAISAAISLSTIPAVARESGHSDARACEHYREEHPGFSGAFDVTAHKAVWNGSGFTDEPRQFECPALAGGESLAAMKIEKVPSHRR